MRSGGVVRLLCGYALYARLNSISLYLSVHSLELTGNRQAHHYRLQRQGSHPPLITWYDCTPLRSMAGRLLKYSDHMACGTVSDTMGLQVAIMQTEAGMLAT